MTKLLPSVRYVLLGTGFSTAIFSRMGCHPCLIAKVSVNSGRTKGEKGYRTLQSWYGKLDIFKLVSSETKSFLQSKSQTRTLFPDFHFPVEGKTDMQHLARTTSHFQVQILTVMQIFMTCYYRKNPITLHF